MNPIRYVIVTALITLMLSACVTAAIPSPDSGQAVNPTAESTIGASPTLEPAPESTAAATATFELVATELPATTPEPTAAEATATTPARGTPVPLEPTATTDPVRGTAVPLPTEAPVDDSLGLAVPMTPELLKNSSYLVPSAYSYPVQLVDGFFQDQSDPNMPVTVRLLEEQIAFGDVDGDGLEDAVVPLATNTGGSGVFMDVVVMSGKSGAAAQVAATYLGDRVIINEITAEIGRVTVNMVVAGPNDPSCCPTQEVTATYVFRDGTLTLEE